MENNTLSKSTYSVGVSLAVCSVLNAALVIAKERSKSVANGMQEITGHHWTTHVLLVLAVFIILGWLLNQKNNRKGLAMSPTSLIRTVLAGVATGIVAILGYYLFAG